MQLCEHAFVVIALMGFFLSGFRRQERCAQEKLRLITEVPEAVRIYKRQRKVGGTYVRIAFQRRPYQAEVQMSLPRRLSVLYIREV